MHDKVDFKKTLACYRASPGDFTVLDVPDLQYLMVDGHGDPNSSPVYRQALESLYPVAYRLKLASRNDFGRDYVVPPLEGLWWAEEMSAFTSARDKSRWEWTMMLMVPDWLDREMFAAAAAQVAARKPPPLLEQVRLTGLHEGRCVQTLHVGPYDAEAGILAELHERFVPDHGLTLTGRHHEIYLNDARRVAPARLRTILRQPVK